MMKSSVFVVTILCCVCAIAQADPLASFGQAWTSQVKWDSVIDISTVSGDSITQRLDTAQAQLAQQGGGVVFFPAGVYHFETHLYLRDGIVLRGVAPTDITDARTESYSPLTRFEFPPYIPTFTGKGTPTDTAFRGIYLADMKASNCGLLNIAVNRGHVLFASEGGHTTGRNRFVVGCVFTNAATADADVPDPTLQQHAWQRFTARHNAAVSIKAFENILVANNRVPESGQDNFSMDDYVVKGTRIQGVVFDYDNRPGLYVNNAGLGGSGGNGPDGTPDTHPWGFRKGIVICQNYVFCTGRCAISFSGDGTLCEDNVIRFKDNVWRPTTTGTNLTKGSSTNDNRAVQMRGWRWTVAGNDYRVYRNLCFDRAYRINDGEGLMHEDHVNSTVLDSKVINNTGNSYISIYKTAGINGLLVKGNNIRTSGGISAIYVVANRNSGPYECRHVTIEDNTTAGSGIMIAGMPASGNVIRNNRHVGGQGEIINQAQAALSQNLGFE